jgi:hypothetical protein
MNMYIISWFGGDKPAKREYNHHRQLEWARKHNLNVFVVCQEYTPEQRQSDVTYLGDNQRMTPGAARNIAKQHFYSTQEDFAIFADDDSWVENIDPDQNWFDLFKGDIKGIDLFLPPSHLVPYVKQFTDLGEVAQHNFYFMRVARLKGSFYVMRNFKKYYGYELYHNKPELLPGEDVHFGFGLISRGHNMYTLANIKLVERYSESTWCTRADRKVKDDTNMRLITQEFGVATKETEKGMRVINFKSLWGSNPAPKTVLIPISTKSNSMFKFSEA